MSEPPLVPREAIVPLPAGVATIRELRDYMCIEEQQALHPDHELFIVAFKVPGNPFAFLLRLRKDVAHIQDRWPLLIDYETRVAVVVVSPEKNS